MAWKFRAYKTEGKKNPGKTIWHGRAKMPFRSQDGTIRWRRVERSTHTGNLARAREKCNLYEREYHEALNKPPADSSTTTTFAAAAITYMRTTGKKRFIAKLLPLIGAKALYEIDQDCVMNVCEQLYPNNHAASINRAVFTPVLAILNLAAKMGKCPPPRLTRPAGHDASPPLSVPPLEWYMKVLPVAPPRQRAFILFLWLHGRRAGEAVSRKPHHVDTSRWTVSIEDTKTVQHIEIRLSEPVIDAIKAIPRWQEQKWLFGTGYEISLTRAIRRTCKKAGVPYYRPHVFGRHAFATRLLVHDGKSIKFVKEAGHWGAMRSMERYMHLERSDVSDEVKKLGDEWGTALTKKKDTSKNKLLR